MGELASRGGGVGADNRHHRRHLFARGCAVASGDRGRGRGNAAASGTRRGAAPTSRAPGALLGRGLGPGVLRE